MSICICNVYGAYAHTQMCMSVYACVCASQTLCACQRTTCRSRFNYFLSPQIPGINLRSLVSTVSSLILWAIFPGPPLSDRSCHPLKAFWFCLLRMFWFLIHFG